MTKDGSAAAIARYSSLTKVISEKREWLAKDPAGYALSNNPSVSEAWKTALGQGAEAVDVRLAVNLTLSEQRRLGIPEDKVRAIPESLAQPLADQITAAPTPDKKLAAIMSLASPKDPEMAGLVLNEIGTHAGKDGAQYAVVGGLALDGPEGQRLALDVLAGMDAVKAGVAKAPTANEVAGAVDEKLGAALAFNPQARAAIVEAASAIYGNDSLKGGTVGGEFDAEAFGKAIDRVIGGVIDWNDGKIIVPRRGMTESDFEDLMDGLTVQDIGGALPLAEDGSPLTIEDIRDADLQTVGDGSYLVTVQGFPVRDPAGSGPFILDLRGVEAKQPAPVMPPPPPGIGFPVKVAPANPADTGSTGPDISGEIEKARTAARGALAKGATAIEGLVSKASAWESSSSSPRAEFLKNNPRKPATAQTDAAVEALASFMAEFERKNG